MILNHKYEGAIVGIMDEIILYGSVNEYSNFKRSGKDCNKCIKNQNMN